MEKKMHILGRFPDNRYAVASSVAL